MKKEEIQQGLKEILSEKFKLESTLIKPQATLHEDLGLDSVEVMDAICLFEEKFNVEIIEGNKEKIEFPETLEGLASLILKRLHKKPAQ